VPFSHGFADADSSHHRTMSRPLEQRSLQLTRQDHGGNKNHDGRGRRALQAGASQPEVAAPMAAGQYDWRQF